MEFVHKYLHPLWDIALEMSPYLLIGFFIAGILDAFVPKTLYQRHFSGNNLRSVALACLFGIPLPLCSCGVIPTAMSLHRNGASKGAATGFMISAPQTGVDSILASVSLLGIPFAIIRPIVALITGLFGGTMVNRICGDGRADCQDNCCDSCATTPEIKKSSFSQKCKSALQYGFVDMIQDIGKWLIIGLFIAALITIFIPDDFFTQQSSSPIVNMILVLLLSIPMYLCATGSVPIAAALMLKGLGPGAALVLLMAGPATNAAAIMVINKVMGRKTLIVYLVSIIISSLAFGMFIEYALPASWFTLSVKQAGAHEHAAVWWQIASVVLLLLLIINAFLLNKKHSHEHSHSHEH